jgi:hypothetical protein
MLLSVTVVSTTLMIVGAILLIIGLPKDEKSAINVVGFSIFLVGLIVYIPVVFVVFINAIFF